MSLLLALLLAARVEAVAGNLHYIADDGAVARLTETGRDADPVLSMDGKLIAFARTAADDPAKSAVWLYYFDRKILREVLPSRAGATPETNLADLRAPAFAPDGRTLYVMASAWVTSDAIHAIDLATGRTRFVTDGNSLTVIARGRYAGWLLVEKHRYRKSGGSYERTFAVSPDGKRKIAIAGSEDDPDKVIAWLRRNGG